MNLDDERIQDNLFDLESERRVLSAILHDEEACIEAYNSLKASDFYSPQHATVYELVMSLYEREIRPTYVELIKEAHSLGLLTNPRDLEEIQFIVEHFIDDQNIKYWIKRVKDKARLRKFAKFLHKSYQLLQSEQDYEVDDLLMEAEEELTNLTALDVDEQVDSPFDLANLGYEEVERRFLRSKEIRGLHKGVIPLDGLPTGF